MPSREGGFLNQLPSTPFPPSHPAPPLPLHLQDSSGMRLWKRKWFVLSDYCLFYYKGEPVRSLLGRPSTADSHQINLFTVPPPCPSPPHAPPSRPPSLSRSLYPSDLSLPMSVSVLLLGVIHAGVAGAPASAPSLITLNNRCHLVPRTLPFSQESLRNYTSLCFARCPLISGHL